MAVDVRHQRAWARKSQMWRANSAIGVGEIAFRDDCMMFQMSIDAANGV